MEQKNKRTYQELFVKIRCFEDDLIKTSNTLEQTEVGISWNEKWSGSWES